MTDQQTDDRQSAGKPGLTRGIFFALCFIFAAILVTIWVKLSSKDIDVAVQPAVEQSAITTNEANTASHGKWYVSLATFRLEKEAVAMLKRIKQKGVKADYVSFIGSRKGYQWYRVRVAGFANEQAAQNELVVLSKKLGIRNARVGEEF
jgi:cell division septation protein DedD